MANSTIRTLGSELYEIVIDEKTKIRLAVRKGKLYVGFADICRFIGYKTPYRIVSEDTEFFKMDIETPYRTGKCAGRRNVKYIEIENAAKFVRDRM